MSKREEAKQRPVSRDGEAAGDRRTEDALRDSETRFRRLFQESAVPGVVVTPDARFRQVNQAFCQFLGYSEEELIGRTVESVTHSDDWSGNWESVRQALGAGPPTQRFEKRYVRKSGEVVWGEVQFSLICDPEGRPDYFLTQILDITKRKRAEALLTTAREELEEKVRARTAEVMAANEQLRKEIEDRRRAEETLRQSEARFRSYFEQSFLGMAVTSPEKRWLQVNDRLCQMLGYTREELVGVKWTDLTHPDDLPRNLLGQYRLQRGDIEYDTIEKRFLRKDGTIVDAAVFARCFRRPDGTVDHFLALFEDITERKRAETALRQSHDELRTIYDGMVDGLHILDLETLRPVRVNAALCRMMGYSEKEALALTQADVHPPEDLPRIVERFRARAGEDAFREENVPILRKDGSVFYADIAASRIVYNERPCLMCFFRDTTERKQAEEALERERRTLRHLLQASDHERQLIAYEIHDGLAQQLAGASMQFQAFDHLCNADSQQARLAYQAAVQLLEQAHVEARRLISGVRPPVLDEAGVDVAIAHLVHDRRAFLGPEIEYTSAVQFERLPAILENALYRIAQEAVANTCKHSRSLKVSVSLVQRDTRVRLEVRDWGIGFDPHSVADGRFGLEGIRERVRLLGGEFGIDSGPGGTLLCVELPLVAPTAAAR